jgi:hypothetical protein
MRKRTAIASAVVIAGLAIGAPAAASAATSAPAHRTVTHQMPAWVHWKYAAKGACGQARRGVVIYASGRDAGAGDTGSVLACPNGAGSTLWLP